MCVVDRGRRLTHAAAFHDRRTPPWSRADAGLAGFSAQQPTIQRHCETGAGLCSSSGISSGVYGLQRALSSVRVARQARPADVQVRQGPRLVSLQRDARPARSIADADVLQLRTQGLARCRLGRPSRALLCDLLYILWRSMDRGLNVHASSRSASVRTSAGVRSLDLRAHTTLRASVPMPVPVSIREGRALVWSVEGESSPSKELTP